MEEETVKGGCKWSCIKSTANSQ